MIDYATIFFVAPIPNQRNSRNAHSFANGVYAPILKNWLMLSSRNSNNLSRNNQNAKSSAELRWCDRYHGNNALFQEPHVAAMIWVSASLYKPKSWELMQTISFSRVLTITEVLLPSQQGKA